MLPKPMLPIGGRPIVWHIMKIYASHGIKDFILCLGYKGWMIKEWFLNYRMMTADITVHLGHRDALEFHGGHMEEDWKVTLAETGLDTMTGGRVAAIRQYIGDDDHFLLTYGDGVADVDVGASIAFHKAHGRVATVASVRPPSRFGEMVLRDGQVRAFTEKPQVTEGSVNGGFFVLDARRIWDYVPNDPALIFEREPLQKLARQGELMPFAHEGFWQPMDTAREFRLLNQLWDEGEASWRRW